MNLEDLVDTSKRVAEVSGRLEKIDRLASLLARVAPEETEIAVAFLTGGPRQGRIGIGPAAIWSAREAAPAQRAALQLTDVDRAFGEIAQATGRGSASARSERLRALMTQATRDEQDFLARLLFGELRQGALDGVLVDAIARASRLPAAGVRRAWMMAGDLGQVARAALEEGEPGIARFLVRLFQPVKPMLADSAGSAGEAIERLGEAAFEYKMDGARIQIHKAGRDIAIYSRNLRDVTAAAPEVVEMARDLPAHELILDGEVIALRPDGAPHPFQITMRRFGRRLDVDRLRHELPLSAFLFDCLFAGGESLLDEPQRRRFDLVSSLAPRLAIPNTIAGDAAAAEAFLSQSLARGHEGVMAKARDAGYAAGNRGASWLKIKQAHTLDLVILAAEWGHGRRRGWLSNLHLGARDPERGAFVMLGKTFKGLTDEMLEWQTRRLLELELGREDYVVHVRPELVVEVAFNDLQESPHYPGGLALRFARVKRYRPDKPAAEADTFEAVQAIYARATGQAPPPRR
jgi:DNA ligase-1